MHPGQASPFPVPLAIAPGELIPYALLLLVGLIWLVRSHRRRVPTQGAPAGTPPPVNPFLELAENGDDIVWVYDLSRRQLIYLAPSFDRLSGIPADAGLQAPRRAMRLIHRADRHRWLRRLAQALEDPSGHYAIEFQLRPPGKPVRWMLDQGVVIRDPQGRPVRLASVARDITARKEAEMALAAERARFRELFENSPEAVFVESTEGVVLDVNHAASRLLGLAPHKLLGRHVTELAPPDTREETRRQFQRLAAGEIWVTESTSLHSNGTAIPVELQVSRIQHEGKEALLIHLRDIRARKEAEAFLAGQKRILEWIATCRPIEDILTELTQVTEARTPGFPCWVHHAAELPGGEGAILIAPSLPASSTAALEGLLASAGCPPQEDLPAGGQPLVLAARSDLAMPPSGSGPATLIGFPIHSAGGVRLGTLGALIPADNPPSPTALDPFRLAANLARIAMERHRDDSRLRDRANRLRAANDALLALARSEALTRGDLSAALTEITETAARAVGAPHVAVWLLDENSGVLRRLHAFPPPDGDTPEPAEIPIHELENYLGALSRERLICISGLGRPAPEPGFPVLPEFKAGTGARLDAGIRLRGRVAGVVVLQSPGTPRSWKAEEELVAGSVADTAAAAIQASERRCIEEALRQSEEAYRSVVSALAEGVILVSRNGRLLTCNQSACDILGLSPDEFASRPMADPAWQAIRPDGSRIPPEEFPARVTLRTGESVLDYIMGIRRSDDSTAWISVNTRPFALDDDGAVGSVVASFTDITRRQEAELALREGHELVRAISEVQAGFIADADPARSIDRMVSSLARMTGAEGGLIAEVIEAPDTTVRLRRFLPSTPPDPAAGDLIRTLPDGPLEAARTSGKAHLVQIPIPECSDHPAGGQGHLLALPLHHDTEVVGVVALVRHGSPFPADSPARLAPLLITCAGLVRAIRNDRQRQEAEARIRQLNAELEERVEQRTADLHAINQELAEFAYVVTHDLKAPLRGIHQLSEWLDQDHAKQLDAAGLRLLALMRQRVLHLQRLVDGLLACARVGRSPEPVSRVATRELIRQVIAVLSPPLRVHFEVDDQLPVVEGNPERLHQIFQNLLDNAVKYLDKEEGRIQVTARRDGGAWLFTVADNGPGIPKRYREKVFQIFQRLHPTGEVPGTGLGLTLVKRIVETRGGRIWIESEADSGTSVCFTWPDHARERAVA